MTSQQDITQQGTTSSARERVGAVAGTAQQEASHVTGEVRSQARRLGGELQDQIGSKAVEGQHRLAATLRDIGTELQSMSQSGERQEGTAHRVSEQLGRQTADLASWLENHEPKDIVDEVSSFARRRPGVFLLGALTLGVLAGRATRGIAAERSTDEQGGQFVGTGRAYGEYNLPEQSRQEYTHPGGYADAGASYTAAGATTEEVGSSAAGYQTSGYATPGNPMEPVPGIDEGARARGVADPAARFPEETQAMRYDEIVDENRNEEGTGRV